MAKEVFTSSSLYESLLDANTMYIKNVCKVGVSGDLFEVTTHNQLGSTDTAMQVASTLSFETCPDGSSAGTSDADVSVSLKKLTKTDDGTEYTAESDFQSFFSAIPANGA